MAWTSTTTISVYILMHFNLGKAKPNERQKGLNNAWDGKEILEGMLRASSNGLVRLNKICKMLYVCWLRRPSHCQEKPDVIRFLISEFLSQGFHIETGLCVRERESLYVFKKKHHWLVPICNFNKKKSINIFQNYFPLLRKLPSHIIQIPTV